MDALASGGGGADLEFRRPRFSNFEMHPKHAWLKLHKRNSLNNSSSLISCFTLSSRGMRSSSLHERWPHGILVTTVDDEACRETEGVICASHRGDRIDIPFCMSPHGATPESLRRCVRSVSYLRYKGPATGAASGPASCPRLTPSRLGAPFLSAAQHYSRRGLRRHPQQRGLARHTFAEINSSTSCLHRPPR